VNVLFLFVFCFDFQKIWNVIVQNYLAIPCVALGCLNACKGG